jgi:hypothetical protein
MANLVTAPQATRLATLDSLKAELGIADAAQDAQLGAYLDQASGLIGGFTGRFFPRAQWQDVFRLEGRPKRSLVLSQRPVLQVESLHIDGQPFTGDAIDLDPQSGVLRPSCRIGSAEWCAWRVVVIYTTGFLLPGQDGRTLPDVVERACLDTAKGMFHAADRDPLVRSESEQGIGSTSWLDPDPNNGGLPASVAAMLKGSGFGRLGIA